MGYSQELFAKVRSEFAEKQQNALKLANERRKELHDRCPEIVGIDAQLAKTGILIMEEIAKGRQGLEERLDMIRLDNEDLQAQRNECMKHYGYPENYDAPRYECAECKDTGYIGTKMCVCMKQELSRQGMVQAGVGALFKTQRFDTFDLGYYEYDQKVFRLLQSFKAYAMKYAEHFSEQTQENLLLCGGTGLGKTHLSTAIAGRVIERGYDVVYESAPNLLAAFEAERFGRPYNGVNAETGRFFTCELLIIDDLGAELTNSFTVGCVYNLINTRLINRKPMIISTNLSGEELRTRYNDRIASRIFGEFVCMRFEGKDVRMLKLGMK